MVAKQVADLVTLLRSTLIVLLPWLGWFMGKDSLPWIVVLMIANWTADSIDGPIARRTRPFYHTWIGDHDLEIDMVISVALVLNLILSGFVAPAVAILYVVVCSVYFLRNGVKRPLGMLFQAPIYVGLTLLAFVEVPTSGWWIIAWCLAAIVVTWPKFLREIIPEFLHDMGELFPRY